MESEMICPNEKCKECFIGGHRQEHKKNETCGKENKPIDCPACVPVEEKK